MPRMPFETRMNWATWIGLGTGIPWGFIPVLIDIKPSPGFLVGYLMF